MAALAERHKRGPRASAMQLEALANYMYQNRGLAMHQYVGEQRNEMWEVLSRNLNKLGPAKSVAQWQRAWTDLKSKTRIKFLALKGEHQLAGKLAMSVKPTELERKVLAIARNKLVMIPKGLSECKKEAIQKGTDDFETLSVVIMENGDIDTSSSISQGTVMIAQDESKYPVEITADFTSPCDEELNELQDEKQCEAASTRILQDTETNESQKQQTDESFTVFASVQKMIAEAMKVLNAKGNHCIE